MSGISDAQWAAYKGIINNAHDYFNQDTVTWVRHTHGLQRFGEDSKSIDKSVNIDLKCLMNYNVYRSWPMSEETPSGQIDKESICIIFNKAYLSSLGYINSNNNLDFDPGRDYFIHQGQILKPAGETPAAQAGDDPLLIYIIARRTQIPTGSNKY
jgi:hypothetical protein